MATSKQTGTIKYFDSERQFGFIKPDNGIKDIFFHASNAFGEVAKDDRVEFDTFEGKKGTAAKNVAKI